MSDEIARSWSRWRAPLPFYEDAAVVAGGGVNGSGKPTTIGKLRQQFRAGGKTVVIAAGDTFRAAAVEQFAGLG